VEWRGRRGFVGWHVLRKTLNDCLRLFVWYLKGTSGVFKGCLSRLHESCRVFAGILQKTHLQKTLLSLPGNPRTQLYRFPNAPRNVFSFSYFVLCLFYFILFFLFCFIYFFPSSGLQQKRAQEGMTKRGTYACRPVFCIWTTFIGCNHKGESTYRFCTPRSCACHPCAVAMRISSSPFQG